jgi:acyl-coenzyme A thioesterase PaaI-like protein
VAFSLAVNSVIDAVGVQWSFSILRMSRTGEELTAESRILHKGRRLIVCELTVTGGDGRLVAQGQATALPVTSNKYRD